MWNIANSENSNQTEDLYKEDKEKLFKEIDEKRDEIFALVDQYTDSDVSGDLKELISNGFQVYVGGRVVHFEISDVEELPTDRLKEDVKAQFREKLNQIKESINEKLYSLSESYESLREKLDDELQKAKDNNNIVPMPDVYERHAEKGLSVVRGEHNDELVWLYSGYYFVRTVDGRRISDNLRRKTIKPVTVRIVTNGNKVSSVKLKRFNKLTNFRHYHSMDGGATDCWGEWNYYIKWDSPDDLIHVGAHALEILTDVNTDSPGNSEPRGLPTLDELVKDARGEERQYSEENEQEDSHESVAQEHDGPTFRDTLIWTTTDS